jgi:hypothetical protein
MRQIEVEQASSASNLSRNVPPMLRSNSLQHINLGMRSTESLESGDPLDLRGRTRLDPNMSATVTAGNRDQFSPRGGNEQLDTTPRGVKGFPLKRA